MRTTSFPNRILLITVLLLVLPLFIIALLQFRASYKDAEKDAKNLLISEAKSKESQVFRILNNQEILLKEITKLLEVENLFPSLPNEKTNKLFKELEEIGNFQSIELYKINSEGRFINVASSDPYFIGVDFTDGFLLQDIYKNKYISFLSYDERPPYDKILFSAEIIYSSKTKLPLGGILVTTDVGPLLKEIFKNNHNDPIKFALLNFHKIVFDATDPDLEMQYFEPLSEEDLKQIRNALIFAQFSLPKKSLDSTHFENNQFFEFEFKNEKMLGYALKLEEETNRYVIAYSPTSAILANPRTKFLLTYSLYIAIVLFSGLILYLLTLLLSKPFKQLCQVMNRLKQKELEARYKCMPFGFEINQLGQILNDTVDSLLIHMKNEEEVRVQKERLEEELKIGREVQMQLLPQQMPNYPNVELAEIFIPAKEVGGDFYDVFIHQNPEMNKLLFAIADTSGKGVSACLYSLGVRSLVRGFGKEISDLKDVITLVNNNFYEESSDSGMFVTLFMASFDGSTHEMRYYSCGHNPPIILRKNGEIEILSNHGIAIGLSTLQTIEEKINILNEGDLILLYTDGVTEATNEQFELFGMDRLINFVKNHHSDSAKTLLQELIKEINTFTNPAPQHDDITLFAMRVLK